jgi:hypothetical protein
MFLCQIVIGFQINNVLDRRMAKVSTPLWMFVLDSVGTTGCERRVTKLPVLRSPLRVLPQHPLTGSADNTIGPFGRSDRQIDVRASA